MIAYGLFVAGVWLARWLPASLWYLMARGAGWLLSQLPLAARDRLRHNLAHVLGVPPDSPALRPYVREAFQTQAQNYVDLCRSFVIAAGQMPDFVPVGDGWDELLRHVREQRGAVLVTGHFGRIELLSHYLGALKLVLTLPVERIQPPALFDLVSRLRRRPTYQLVPHDAALRPCLRAVARGQIAVFFADWDPTGHGVLVPFFGVPTRLPAGPAVVARRNQAPIFIGYQLPGERANHYRVVMEAPLHIPWSDNAEEDVRRATRQIAAVFERCIVQHPGRWVMFHRLWPDYQAGGGMVECEATETLGAAMNGVAGAAGDSGTTTVAVQR
jgi:KDO2-lipid IV(A) lauroyltransferase